MSAAGFAFVAGLILGPTFLLLAWLGVGAAKWGFTDWWFTLSVNWTGKEPVIALRLHKTEEASQPEASA